MSAIPVTGASGQVGGALVEELVGRGAQTRAMVRTGLDRNPSDPNPLDDDNEGHACKEGDYVDSGGVLVSE